MDVVKFLTENWMTVVVGLCAVGAFISFTWKFFKMPGEAQIKKVKEWLLWAVIKAEKELQGGTGELKLRRVYDMFLVKFPQIAMVLSFETFANYVEEAVKQMKQMISVNKKIEEYIDPKGEFLE